MQCHKPGHRAPARCASALLAAGALLATAVDRLGGPASGPALGPAAMGIPQNPAARPVMDRAPAQADEPLSPEARTRSERPAPAQPQKQRKQQKQGKQQKKAAAKKSVPKSVPKKSAPHKAAPAKKSTAKHAKPAANHSKPPSHSKPLTRLPVPTNPKAAKAVREALSLMGVPYRWGGTTRAGFDCSGFTQHVWAAAGVKIPRTVRQQADAGTPVPLNQAQPGDLVVFYPSQHHVGLFIGNGLVVDSPHTGSSVRTDPIRSMPVSTVVRPRM